MAEEVVGVEHNALSNADPNTTPHVNVNGVSPDREDFPSTNADSHDKQGANETGFQATEENLGEEDETSDEAPLLAGDFTIDEGIEICGLGLHQYKQIVATSATWIVIAMQWMVLPFLLRRVEKEFHTTSLQQGLLSSSGILGLILGGPIFGSMSDKFGRKPIAIATILLTGIGSALGAVATGWIGVALTRVIVGLGTNGVLCVSNNHLCEAMPIRHRGFWLAFLHLMWQMGAFITIGLTYIIPDSQWKTLLVVISLPSLVSAACTASLVSESPRFFLVSHQNMKAFHELRAMALTNGAVLPPGSLRPVLEEDVSTYARLGQLISSPRLRNLTLVLMALWFTLNFGSYGNFIYLLEYLSDRDKEALGKACYLALVTGNCFGITVLLMVVEQVDRRVFLLMGYTSVGAICFVFFQMPGDALIILTTVVLGLATEIIWGEIYIVTPEMFPSTVRGTGVGLAMGPGRIGALVGALIGPAVYSANNALIFYMNGVAFLLGAVAVSLLPFETRGRPLQDSAQDKLPASKSGGSEAGNWRDRPMLIAACPDLWTDHGKDP